LIVYQVTLKKFDVKALVSGDKGLRLEFYANIPDPGVDTNQLQKLLHKPLLLEIKEDNSGA